MIRINLLPYREKAKKENIKRQVTIIAGSFIFFLLILVYLQISLSSSLSTLEAKIKEKDEKLVVLAKKLGDIEGLKRSIKELEQKLSVIKGLEADRFFPVRMLAELAQLVPPKDIWLEKISAVDPGLRIEGVARDNMVVARFMKSLEFSSFVSSVSLVSTKEKEVSGFKLQQFTLSCALKKG
ncbi:MAG: PilN domain-containing protein [Deltaproteobacteria bacterium]|nr:PilN domain-containing protein [Deltaproteobacteria bacterium]